MIDRIHLAISMMCLVFGVVAASSCGQAFTSDSFKMTRDNFQRRSGLSVTPDNLGKWVSGAQNTADLKMAVTACLYEIIHSPAFKREGLESFYEKFYREAISGEYGSMPSAFDTTDNRVIVEDPEVDVADEVPRFMYEYLVLHVVSEGHSSGVRRALKGLLLRLDEVKSFPGAYPSGYSREAVLASDF